MSSLATPAAVPLAHQVIGRGPLVLLLAGTGYAGATWGDTLVAALAEQFTVATFDYRGTGATPGTDDDYTTRIFATDVVGLIDELGRGPAHVLGHSMGGRVAQWVALDAPDRVASLVLAASGPGEFRPDHEATTGIPLATALALAEKGFERMIADQIRSTFFTQEFNVARPDVVDALIAAFLDNRPSLRDYLKHVAARQGHRTVEQLADIDCRTLVIVGDHDTNVGGTGSHLEQSRYLAAHIRAATLEVVPGLAHGLFWQTPDATMAAVTRFLEG